MTQGWAGIHTMNPGGGKAEKYAPTESLLHVRVLQKPKLWGKTFRLVLQRLEVAPG